MESYGVRMILTGGETADVGDLVRTVIVDSTVCARVRRSDIIDNSRIAAGDVIVGLASFGQAEYEDEYNGGTGSNGLTSARHDLFAHYLAEKYPESYDHAMPVSLVYSGSRMLTETEPETGLTYGKLLLSPTRTYAPVMNGYSMPVTREGFTVWCTVRAVRRPRFCISLIPSRSSKTICSLYLHSSRPFR